MGLETLWNVLGTYIKAFYDYGLWFQVTSHSWRVELPYIAGVAFQWYACVRKDSV